MKFSEALDQVSKAYIPGVVAFYAQLDPDPWQEAHDILDEVLETEDQDLILLGIKTFANRCLELIDLFKQTGLTPKYLSIADAFHIGSERMLAEISSRKYKHCFKCQAKEGLSIINSPTDERAAVVICGKCRNGM
jgi:hypothetical protein